MFCWSPLENRTDWQINKHFVVFQHAYALEQLREHLREGSKALDVGSGSGYLTVCMALMVGESGQTVGIDHIPELVEFSRKNVLCDKPELLESGRLKLIGKFQSASPFFNLF